MQIVDSPVNQPWNKLPDEPDRWFAAFDQYRLLGPSRSVHAAWQLDHSGSQSKAWSDAAKDYQWAERAAAWDSDQRESEQAAFLANQAKAREYRQKSINRLESLLEKLQGVALDRDKVSISEVSRLAHVARVIHAESRLEYEPARGGLVINNSNTAVAANQTVKPDFTDEDRIALLEMAKDLGLLDGTYESHFPPAPKKASDLDFFDPLELPERF